MNNPTGTTRPSLASANESPSTSEDFVPFVLSDGAWALDYAAYPDFEWLLSGEATPIHDLHLVYMDDTRDLFIACMGCPDIPANSDDRVVLLGLIPSPDGPDPRTWTTGGVFLEAADKHIKNGTHVRPSNSNRPERTDLTADALIPALGTLANAFHGVAFQYTRIAPPETEPTPTPKTSNLSKRKWPAPGNTKTSTAQHEPATSTTSHASWTPTAETSPTARSNGKRTPPLRSLSPPQSSPQTGSS